jgi:UDP-N-acetylmuramyl tripeptide synthase
VLLEDVEGGHVRLRIGGRDVEGELALTGAYNMLNAAAALALTRAILGDAAEPEGLMRALAAVRPAFGRGEAMVVDGQRLELVLVKNPVGFRLALSSLPPAGYRTMIAINDSAADGRDVSWLWDVDFDSLRPEGVETVSGVRAYDMALRLHYDLVPFGAVEPDLATALQRFLSGSRGHPRRIYCTYTAMLALRRRLARVTPLEAVT